MAFNLQAFGAGFAKKLTEDLDDKRDRINKLADDEAMIATRQRLAKQAKRDEEQEIADNLVESLSLYFTPEQIEDIVPRGKIAVAHAVSKGKFYDEKGMSASSMYTMPNNDIASIDTANTTSIGEISKTADVPEGMGIDSFASRFTPIKPTKEFKTIAAFQVALLQERIDAGDDPDKIAIVDEKERQFFAQASKLEDAKRKPDDVDGIKEFYSPSQRLELIKNQRTIARNTLDLSVGSMGQLVGKYKGTNKLGMAELDTAIMLQNQNDVVAKEESLYGEIKAIAKNAKVTLDNYAQSKILSKDEDTYKMFESETLMKEAAASGALPRGSVYAVANPEGGYLIGTYVGSTYKDLGIPSYLNAANVDAKFFNAE
jgi:hypothetical protein